MGDIKAFRPGLRGTGTRATRTFYENKNRMCICIHCAIVLNSESKKCATPILKPRFAPESFYNKIMDRTNMYVARRSETIQVQSCLI